MTASRAPPSDRVTSFCFESRCGQIVAAGRTLTLWKSQQDLSFGRASAAPISHILYNERAGTFILAAGTEACPPLPR